MKGSLRFKVDNISVNCMLDPQDPRSDQSSFGAISSLAETKIPSKNFLSSFCLILQTPLIWAQQRETMLLSIPSKMSSFLTSLADDIWTVQPSCIWIKWDLFPPKKFLISICFLSLEMMAVMGKCACTIFILYLKPYNVQKFWLEFVLSDKNLILFYNYKDYIIVAKI